MLRLLADNDFNERVIAGCLAREPRVDIVRVRDIGMGDAADPDILARAAVDGRVVLTHDLQTMVGHAADRVNRGLRMTGVLAVHQNAPIGLQVEHVLIAVICSPPDEMMGMVQFLPL
jgi:predicted nuclease of predicted toxin-antitoxin system